MVWPSRNEAPIKNAAAAAGIYFILCFALYWGDVSSRGFWSVLVDRLLAALTFGALLLIWNVYLNRRRRKIKPLSPDIPPNETLGTNI